MPIKTGDQITAGDFRGMIMMWPNATPPQEWLLCDGSAVSRVTYADLFALLGTTFGDGDGSTTFNVPDMRGSVPIGAGQKTRTLSFDYVPTDLDLTLDGFVVDDARRLGNAQPVTLTQQGNREDRMGVPTGHSSNISVTSGSQWIGIGNNPCPTVDTKVCFLANGNSTGIVGLKYVVEVNSTRTAFKVSNSIGGGALTVAVTDTIYWAKVEPDNTEGESDLTSWSSTGDRWSLGGNAMPEVGDRIWCTYESSTSPNFGGIYTVSAVYPADSQFYTGNLGSDSGTVRWVNLGPNPLSQDIPDGTYYTVYIDETHFGLAFTFEEAIQGTKINFSDQGSENYNISLTNALRNKTLGQEGGHEENNMTVPELPSHIHGPNNLTRNEGAGFDNSDSGGESAIEGSTDATGGSQTQSLMQPYVTLNFIIKT